MYYDSSLLITMNANEEEPGEAEKKDATEEPLSLPESWQLTLRRSQMKEKLLLVDLEITQEIIREIILPPPEFLRIS